MTDEAWTPMRGKKIVYLTKDKALKDKTMIIPLAAKPGSAAGAAGCGREAAASLC